MQAQDPRRCWQVLGGRVAVNDSAGNRHLVDSAGADPGLSDVLWARLGLQHSGDLSPVADLMIPCLKRDLAPSVTLAADLPVQGFVVGRPSPTGRSRLPAPGAAAAAPSRSPSVG